MEIRVLDGVPVTKPTKAFNYGRTNQSQSFAEKNYEPRESGASRVWANSGPGSPQLNGYDRTEIMQGYMGADDDDMNDWEFAVTMEHPEVMNGIQSMQGKKERQARKAARQENKANNQKKAVRPAKAARKAKKAQKQSQRTTKKNLKLAKKEEKIKKRESKRETRKLDHEAKRTRKAARGENVKAIFSELGQNAKEVISRIVDRPDAFDDTALEMGLPEQAQSFLDRWRDMPLEDVMDEREELLTESDTRDGAAKPDAPKGENSGPGLGLITLGVLGVAALSSGKKKKGKKK